MLKRTKKEEVKTSTQNQQSIQTIIGEETIFEGTISTKTPIRIDGTIKGDIDSENTVIIGSTGKIEGTIKASDLYIAGNIDGEVTISNKTEFVAGGYLLGNLSTTDLIMESGASFDGMCKTKNKQPSQPKVKEKVVSIK